MILIIDPRPYYNRRCCCAGRPNNMWRLTRCWRNHERLQRPRPYCNIKINNYYWT